MDKTRGENEFKDVTAKLDEFEERAQRIMDKLDQANAIFDNMQPKTCKPDKSTDIFEDVLEPIERGIKRLFSSIFSQFMGTGKTQKETRPAVSENLASYLQSCTDEQLEAIKKRIEEIQSSRGSV